jgi:hypothetical protein
MCKHTTTDKRRKWYDSAHASLCLLGSYLCAIAFFRPIEEDVKIKQKVLKYTPVQKLEMLFVALLAGAKAVYQTGTTLRVDPAMQTAFGLPGCAEQSVIADTLDAATEQDVHDLRQAIETIFRQHSQAQHHDFAKEPLILDIDLSPLPASGKAEGSQRGYMGRSRSKTGRKLVRVRASQYQETVYEDVLLGRTAESLTVLQEAVQQAERWLGLDGEGAEARAKRERTEVRLDSGWGGEEMINWLLWRGYQVTGKFKSNSRVQKLVQPIVAWMATSSPGREVAVVPKPVALARPTRQYAVRTPSKDKPGGYYHAVLFTTRLELTMLEVVAHYDERAGMESDLKGDKRGLGLATLRKHKLAAQKIVVLLVGLAHNVLIWARGWLAKRAPRLAGFGIVRLVQQVWAVPGRVKVMGEKLKRLRLNPQHPQAQDVGAGLSGLLLEGQTLGFLG